ncbi:MAG: type II toxin-antitoxin system VapC family toxin [Thermomicrobiales bacterium]
MKYLFDTDCLIDAIGNRFNARELVALLGEDGIAVSIITVAETYDGAFGTENPARTLAAFRDFLADYAALPVTDTVAARFAELRSLLRRQGQPIPDMDLLIAATAVDTGLTLVTRNLRHFSRIPALRIYPH